jgi:hypothetical protein
MLSSIGRIVFALLRFAIGAGLALAGAGMLRHDPRVPAALVHLAMQPPFGELLWSLVALAGGIALMLHALPSPWRTDRMADRGEPVAPPEREAAPPVRRTFDAPVAPPVRWQRPALDLSPFASPELQPVPAATPAPSAVAEPCFDEMFAMAPAVAKPTEPDIHVRAPRTADAFPAPVFRSRPPPRRPSRAQVIGQLPS